jgi:hypothetical protein
VAAFVALPPEKFTAFEATEWIGHKRLRIDNWTAFLGVFITEG